MLDDLRSLGEEGGRNPTCQEPLLLTARVAAVAAVDPKGVLEGPDPHFTTKISSRFVTKINHIFLTRGFPRNSKSLKGMNNKISWGCPQSPKLVRS